MYKENRAFYRSLYLIPEELKAVGNLFSPCISMQHLESKADQRVIYSACPSDTSGPHRSPRWLEPGYSPRCLQGREQGKHVQPSKYFIYILPAVSKRLQPSACHKSVHRFLPSAPYQGRFCTKRKDFHGLGFW